MKVLSVIFGLFVMAAPARAQSPYVHLSWPESHTRGIEGYNVLRATCSDEKCDSMSDFAQVNIFPVERQDQGSRFWNRSMHFDDRGVARGTTYAYKFITICPLGGCKHGVEGESVDSNVVIVTIPANGKRPTVGRLTWHTK
jgi:hypothetical protein